MPRSGLPGVVTLTDLYGPGGKTALVNFRSKYNAVYRCPRCGNTAGRPDNVRRVCQHNFEYDEVEVVREDPITGQKKTYTSIEWVHFMFGWNNAQSPTHLQGYGNESVYRADGLVAAAIAAGVAQSQQGSGTASTTVAAATTTPPEILRQLNAELEEAMRRAREIIRLANNFTIVSAIMRGHLANQEGGLQEIDLEYQGDHSDTSTASPPLDNNHGTASGTMAVRDRAVDLSKAILSFDEQFKRAVIMGNNMIAEHGFTPLNIMHLMQDVISVYLNYR